MLYPLQAVCIFTCLLPLFTCEVARAGSACKPGPVEFCGRAWPADTREITCYERHGSLEAMDLSPVACLPKLETLVLVSGEIEFVQTLKIDDIRPISGLERLRVLKLGHTTVSDLGPLAGLARLEEFGLHASPVGNLQPLAKLTNLKVLDLSCTGVRDLRPLAKLVRLERLDLSGTSVQDLSALDGFEKLEWLALPSRHPVPKDRVEALRRRLPKLQVTYGNRCCD